MSDGLKTAMQQEPKVAIDCLPCPFCGGQPIIEPWHGGTPSKKMIFCTNDLCNASPSVTGETAREAKHNWNTRWNGDNTISLRIGKVML